MNQLRNKLHSFLSLVLLLVTCVGLVVVPLVHTHPLLSGNHGSLEHFQKGAIHFGYANDVFEENNESEIHTGLADHIDHIKCQTENAQIFLDLLGNAIHNHFESTLFQTDVAIRQPSIIINKVLPSRFFSKNYYAFRSTLSPPLI